MPRLYGSEARTLRSGPTMRLARTGVLHLVKARLYFTFVQLLAAIDLATDEATAMEAFEYTPLPGRVVFGSGTLTANSRRDGVDGLQPGVRAVGCCITRRWPRPGFWKSLATGPSACLPMPPCIRPSRSPTRSKRTERCIAGLPCSPSVGARRPGLSKALALRTGLPQIVVPTTYAGSEATSILGQTEQGRKTTLRSPRCSPRVIVYDVELTLGMPARLSIVSGMNAMATRSKRCTPETATP